MTSQEETSYLLKKVEGLEMRFENHISKIDTKLDQLFRILESVATIQEREQRNSDDIREVKQIMRDTLDKFDNTIRRIHDSLDKKDFARQEEQKDLNKKILTIESELESMIEVVDSKVIIVDKKVAAWLNRGVGLWTGLSILVLVFQVIGGFFVSSIRDDYKSIKSQVADINRKQIEVEYKIDRITEPK